MAATSSNGPPTLPCKFCRRKFGTLQAVGAHQKAHRIEHAIARKKHLSQLAGRSSRNPSRKTPVGMCACCMETSPLGNRITFSIQQAYFLRLQKLAMMRQRQVQASCVVPSNAALASTSCSRIGASRSIAGNVMAGATVSSSSTTTGSRLDRVELDLISKIPGKF